MRTEMSSVLLAALPALLISSPSDGASSADSDKTCQRVQRECMPLGESCTVNKFITPMGSDGGQWPELGGAHRGEGLSGLATPY